MREKMRIHGRKILGFPCGDVEVEQQICDFYIEEDSHEFVIEVDDYPIENIDAGRYVIPIRKGKGVIETSIMPISNKYFNQKRFEK